MKEARRKRKKIKTSVIRNFALNLQSFGIEEFMNWNGSKVRYSSSVKEAMLIMRGEQSAIIIDDELEVAEQEFLILHELGHWILHSYVTSDSCIQFETDEQAEKEADLFATYLLIHRHKKEYLNF